MTINICPICKGVTNWDDIPIEQLATTEHPCECAKFMTADLAVVAEPVKFDPQASQPESERPKIGKAIIMAYESMTREELGDANASAILESKLCPLLANALTQPLALEWVCEYFIAVQMVQIDNDKPIGEAMRQTLATYILMACGQIPWPSPPREDAEETGGASAS